MICVLQTRISLEINFIVCQSWLWADLGLPGVCVCLCVLTGIELWIYWSDFNGILVPVYCNSLVEHCKI